VITLVTITSYTCDVSNSQCLNCARMSNNDIMFICSYNILLRIFIFSLIPEKVLDDIEMTFVVERDQNSIRKDIDL
jgi:hypothetical protein